MALITDTNYGNNNVQRNRWNTTRTDRPGLDVRSRLTDLPTDSTTFSAEALSLTGRGTATQTVDSGSAGIYNAGILHQGQVQGRSEAGGFALDSQGSGTLQGGFVGNYSTTAVDNESGVNYNAQGRAQLGVHANGNVRNEIATPVGTGSLELRGGGFVGGTVGSSSNFELTDDTVRYNATTDYGFGATFTRGATADLYNERGSGLSLGANQTLNPTGVTGHLGVSLGREGDVNSIGLAGIPTPSGTSIDIGVSLHDQDGIDLTSGALGATSDLFGDTQVGRTAATFDQYVRGDLDALSVNPMADSLANPIINTVDTIDGGAQNFASASRDFHTFTQEAEQGIYHQIESGDTHWAVGGVQIAGARALGGLGRLGQGLGTIIDRTLGD
jgi:hypothetical protein